MDRSHPSDVLLVGELYAQWRIPDYWIVDVEGRYLTRRELTPERRYSEDSVAASRLSAVDTSEIWPR